MQLPQGHKQSVFSLSPCKYWIINERRLFTPQHLANLKIVKRSIYRKTTVPISTARVYSVGGIKPRKPDGGNLCLSVAEWLERIERFPTSLFIILIILKKTWQVITRFNVVKSVYRITIKVSQVTHFDFFQFKIWDQNVYENGLDYTKQTFK